MVFIHDWLVAMRGGEKVLEVLHGLWPEAPIYTLVADCEKLEDGLRSARIKTSFLQHIPGSRRFHRWLLPLYPWAVQRWNLPQAKLAISISHSFAKGTHLSPETVHICYCLTPMRYVWNDPNLYFSRIPPFLGRKRFVEKLRQWDLETNKGVDQFVAISQTVGDRIQQWYGRQAQVIYPPVDCQRFLKQPREPKDFYLVVSALVPYKRADLAIEACRKLGRKLVVVGDGPCRRQLERQSDSRVTFLGWTSGELLEKMYAQARALLYPQEEDFGIAALEAQAAGCPVVAYRAGGARETVLEGRTGLFFETQSVESLAQAMENSEKLSFQLEVLRRQALRFDRTVFERSFRQLVETACAAGGSPHGD